MKEPDVCERCGKAPVPPDFIFVGICGVCMKAQKAKYAPKPVQIAQQPGFWEHVHYEYERTGDR